MTDRNTDKTKRRCRMKTETMRELYAKPELVKHENLKDITFECPAWQCSVVVPPPPAA
jgi:hypothetical protein